MITVTGTATPRSGRTTWIVRQDGRTMFGSFDKADAESVADDLAEREYDRWAAAEYAARPRRCPNFCADYCMDHDYDHVLERRERSGDGGPLTYQTRIPQTLADAWRQRLEEKAEYAAWEREQEERAFESKMERDELLGWTR